MPDWAHKPIGGSLGLTLFFGIYSLLVFEFFILWFKTSQCYITLLLSWSRKQPFLQGALILFSEEWFLETKISILLVHSYYSTSVADFFFSPFTTSSLRGISCYQVPFFIPVVELFQHSHNWSLHFSSLFLSDF